MDYWKKIININFVIIFFAISFPVILLFIGCRAYTPVFQEEIGKGQPLPDTYVGHKDPEPMKLVPAGFFLMGNEAGDEDEKPRHRVFVNAFYMDEAEVTCARYGRFLKETGYPPHQLWDPKYDRPGDPVVGVSWYDAVAFAAWACKRLPQEAEWEKAAAGGLAENKYPTGDEIDKEMSNFDSFGTTPVKSYAPNGYGLYDMSGNVWEWCRDWYSRDYYMISTGKNPAGPQLGIRQSVGKKVVRGGAWYCNKTALRISNRHKNDPDFGSFNIGFRCVKPVKEVK
jgi:formylglycine-generating enzyme required for sulfatase activity